MGGNATAYKSGSFEELRVRIALEAGVLSPCIQLFKRSNYSMIEDIHKISEIFDPSKQPHELCSVNNEELGKKKIADWAPRMWIYTCALHLRYGDVNFAQHAEPLMSADIRFREKMEGWVTNMCFDRAAELDAQDIHAAAALKVDLNVLNIDGDTLLHKTALSGNLDATRALLIMAGASLGVTDTHGRTPLRRAAYKGHVEVVRVLIEAGASLGVTDKGGCTPLHWAAYKGHDEVVRVLIDAGASLDVTNANGRTPLHWAALNGHVEVVRFIIKAGASLDMTDTSGSTPLVLAATEECRRLLRDQ